MRQKEAKSEQLLTVLRESIIELAGELHPQLPPPRCHLNSSLERDVGLDSLARMELLARLEKRLATKLSEQAVFDAETVAELLQVVQKAAGARDYSSPKDRVKIAAEPEATLPDTANTLVEVLEWHLQHHPERPHVHLYNDADSGEVLSYRDIWSGAQRVARGLQLHKLEVGAPVAIMLPTGSDYLVTFFGILLAGGVPVPIYPPLRMAQMEDHLRRQRGILGNCQAQMMVTMPEALPFARLLKAQLTSLKRLVTVKQLSSCEGAFVLPQLHGADTAFLQYTSGSTGSPKGVVLSHANLLANIRAMGEAVAVVPDDVIISWLPLYHDMGLIGTWLSSLYYAVPLVLLSPLDFLSRPQRWLWAIHRFQGTLSPAPNFAYELCLNKVPDEELEGLDLSSWRGAFNGAEPVSPSTLSRFIERFTPYGFQRESLQPVYGMAENSVGLAFPRQRREPLVDRVQREIFSRQGRAEPADDDENALQFVGCGQPLREHEVRIVDPAGRELGERQQGQVQFRGPSACCGYYRNEEQTTRLFDGDWLYSGDLGYLAGGDLFITGRVKDVIIVAGRNIYPHELEEAVGNLPGIRKGNVAVFAAKDTATAGEKLVVLAESRVLGHDDQQPLQREIRELAVKLLGTPPGDLVLAAPRTIPKTSSGKVRRSACRELYEKGMLQRGESRLRLVAHLGKIVFGAQLRRLSQSLGALAFAVYAWTLFALLAGGAWLAVMTLPRMTWRWQALHEASRLLRWATRTPMQVSGVEHLPQDMPCVLVANHASYLDGFVLVAALPQQFCFIAKAELQARAAVRRGLQRIGTEFVERFERVQGVDDARRLSEHAAAGQSLMYFPEGTFRRGAGLRPFFMGAYLAAAEAALPIVPVAIHGTRSMLVGRSWFPRRGKIRVEVGEPLWPQSVAGKESQCWREAVRLRDASRAYIARHCGEPDLERR